MKLSLRYFASIRETVGVPAESFETEASSLGALRDQLIARGGPHAHALARGKALRMAIDQDMADDEAAPLHDGAEVAFFPPVTGG